MKSVARKYFAAIACVVLVVAAIGCTAGKPDAGGDSRGTKTYPAAVTLEADGWNDGDGEFSYEVVDADGKAAARTRPSTCPREPTR